MSFGSSFITIWRKIPLMIAQTSQREKERSDLFPRRKSLHQQKKVIKAVQQHKTPPKSSIKPRLLADPCLENGGFQTLATSYSEKAFSWIWRKYVAVAIRRQWNSEFLTISWHHRDQCLDVAYPPPLHWSTRNHFTIDISACVTPTVIDLCSTCPLIIIMGFLRRRRHSEPYMIVQYGARLINRAWIINVMPHPSSSLASIVLGRTWYDLLNCKHSTIELTQSNRAS